MERYRPHPDDALHDRRMTAMFNRIAGRYDRLNRVMTFGLDRWWRRRLVRALDPARHARVLDVCTGTGDVALLLARRGHRTVGLDAAREMLALARGKDRAGWVRWCQGDCRALPFPGGHAAGRMAPFDAATIAFGIRNIADRVAALRELGRVVRPGGRLVVLEALPAPSRLWRWITARYDAWIVPLMGAALARDRSAYRYLGGTIAGFGTAEAFERELVEAGWRPIARESFARGSVALFVAARDA